MNLEDLYPFRHIIIKLIIAISSQPTIIVLVIANEANPSGYIKGNIIKPAHFAECWWVYQ